jgi:hypothetical protein
VRLQAPLPSLHNRSRYPTSSWQISIHSCCSCACSETTTLVAFGPRGDAFAPKKGRAEHRAAPRGCSVQLASYERRVRTNHQAVTRLSKRWEQRQR